MSESTHVPDPATIAASHNCDRHRGYKMTCQNFAALRARAAGGCETCDRVEPECLLHIDHDHQLGRHAVRGMVCPPCNQRLHWIDKGEEPKQRFRDYLESPFWHTLGYPSQGTYRIYQTRVESGRPWWNQERVWMLAVPLDLPKELRDAAKKRAEAEGISLSAAVRRMLEEYAREGSK